jgi:hypothetical protein
MLYFLSGRDALGSSDQRGLRNGTDVQIGGGVHVATLSSDARVVAHSNMRTVVLWRNFSSAAFVSRWLNKGDTRGRPQTEALKAKAMSGFITG